MKMAHINLPVCKVYDRGRVDALVKAMDGEAGDLLLFAADKNKIVWDVLGNLRLEIARNLDLLDKNVYKFLWVTEFPEFDIRKSRVVM